MAPSPLHGLNIVHTDAPPSPDTQFADASQDPLLANAPFPDLAAQLDLWSNLTFQTDEPLVDKRGRKPAGDDQASRFGGDDDKDEDGEVEGPASLEGHVNAVNPTAISNPPSGAQQSSNGNSNNNNNNYDMNAFLAGFGIDSFAVSQIPAPPPPPAAPQAATLAQLLAAYPFAGLPFGLHVPTTQVPAVAPAALSIPSGEQQQQQQQQQRRSTKVSGESTAPPASTKRSRTRKQSLAINTTTSTAASTPAPNEDDETPTSPTICGPLTHAQTLSAAEDKRRRNTAASARFRLKKKEREAALEKRAQELETRVSTLERECEGLRRENGWLKGLVVGVTGASQGAAGAAAATGGPSGGVSQGGSGSSTATGTGSGSKRKRTSADDVAGAGEAKAKKVAVTA